MNILVFNCGSSSQGFKVYEVAEDGAATMLAAGLARNVATRTQAVPEIAWTIGGVAGSCAPGALTHRSAARRIVAILRDHEVTIDAVGHRFVHGGPALDRTVRIDDSVIDELRGCSSLAPIHNPNSLDVVEVCLDALPGVPQYAVFDTAFHAGMPEVARQYAIPRELAETHGFRKYGFHGLSYEYVATRTAELMDLPLRELRLIVCHLGTGGSSVVAVKRGETLDTSTGYSPCSGLVMSTRSGDVDPEIVLEMVRRGMSPDEVGGILNERSGLIGLSGFSSSLLEVIAEAERGNARCRLAYEIYAHRLRSYLGAYSWLLGSADAIVFTDTVGVRAWQLRKDACAGVESLGVMVDEELNRSAPSDRASLVSAAASRTRVWVIPTDEEVVIMREVLAGAARASAATAARSPSAER